MNSNDELKLFNELYKLYENTKGEVAHEPFTFWVKPKAESGIFNGTQNTSYTNVGIVQIQSSAFREPFVGFRFHGNEVVLRIGKASEKADVDKFINKAKKINEHLLKHQIVIFLEEAQKQFESWKHSWIEINDDLIEKLRNEYNYFFSFVKKYDSDHSTNFYDILKISNKIFEENVKKNKELKHSISVVEEPHVEEKEPKTDGKSTDHEGMIQDGDDNTKPPLNLILYGPPGTGKTYNTLFHALKIINGEDTIKGKSYDDLKPEFDRLVSQGQIVFTTFHQSMSYEDFIEGIKPIPPRNNEEQMVYDVQDGLFKQICEKAKKISVVNTSTKIDFSKTRVFKMSLGEKGKDADSVFEYCVENEVLALGWGDSKDFSTCKTRADFKKLDPTWGAAALEIFKEWMKPGDIVLISDGTKEVKGIAQVDGDYEFRDDPSIDMHQFRKAKWLYTGDNIPISKLYDKNLSQQSIYGFYKEKKGVVDNGGIKIDVLNEIITGEINDKKEENYVLIIDEINRGNVAQIFGELITLIEPSKRLGNSEEMKAILPYSSAQKGNPVYFGVPNNLYIIGTMNTADRSVEALDTALRRRFDFEEMMPKYDPDLLKTINVNNGTNECDLAELLKTINQRIVVLKDREHQIGHSYFMKCKTEDDLKKAFKKNIVPLLQEYFYGNYAYIGLVLGNMFVMKDEVANNPKFAELEGFSYDSGDETIYRLLTDKEWENLNLKEAIVKLGDGIVK